ncbi:MAG: aspartate racemase [Micromonosporaceae bacterium]
MDTAIPGGRAAAPHLGMSLARRGFTDRMTATGYSGALGVLGGMGPAASTGFLQTVYETAAEQSGSFAEQVLPRCLLDSDPAFPDRTEAIRTGGEAQFTARLVRRLADLEKLGATRIVLACVTAHHFLYRLDPARRAQMISLVDVILDDLEAVGEGERLLLVATHGTREARILERSDRWPAVAHRVVLPGPKAQDTLHRLLYRLKWEPLTDELTAHFLRIVAEHDCQGLIAGCTEVHLLTRRLRGGGQRIVDPLLTIATQLKSLLAE